MSREYRNFCAKFGELMRWKKGQEQGPRADEWDDRSDNPLVETQLHDGTVVWDFRDPVDPNDLIANIPPWQKKQVERLSAAMKAGRTVTMHPDGRFEFGPARPDLVERGSVVGSPPPYDWAEEDEGEGEDEDMQDHPDDDYAYLLTRLESLENQVANLERDVGARVRNLNRGADALSERVDANHEYQAEQIRDLKQRIENLEDRLNDREAGDE